MILDCLAVHAYRLALTEPVVWGGKPYQRREGRLLRLATQDGCIGWGDAAPLPGFSRESLSSVDAALVEAAAWCARRAVEPAEAVQPDSPLHAALDGFGWPSSVRYAVDLALADVAAQTLGCALPRALSARSARWLPTAGLVLGGDAVAHAAQRVQEGYRTVKLKVGRGAVETDAATVQAVRQAVGPDVALRLDANRAWSLDDAFRFAEGIASAAVAFVEEPLADPDALELLTRRTGLPVALDETLQAPGGAVAPWAAAAVLKPTLVGGLAATLRLAADAQRLQVPVVLSAAFESGIGLRGVVALAAATGAQAAGLDPYRWLATDVLNERLPLARPVIDVEALWTLSPAQLPP